MKNENKKVSSPISKLEKLQQNIDYSKAIINSAKADDTDENKDLLLLGYTIDDISKEINNFIKAKEKDNYYKEKKKLKSLTRFHATEIIEKYIDEKCSSKSCSFIIKKISNTLYQLQNAENNDVIFVGDSRNVVVGGLIDYMMKNENEIKVNFQPVVETKQTKTDVELKPTKKPVPPPKAKISTDNYSKQSRLTYKIGDIFNLKSNKRK